MEEMYCAYLLWCGAQNRERIGPWKRQPVNLAGLTDAGLHVDIRDVHGDTPLHYASLMHISRDWHIMDVLLVLGAHAGSLNNDFMSPMTLRARGLAFL
ncbi:hypothetical protein CPLU01_04427 [Colletotrichum plurivorum]|uniref:Uncharacterized protein n=1 Tax=Colletotrichum plurivorum TaxID=2175906 RepID=A0A8H6KPN6_9PEZI|nr:hypothetical protein CPLU01_04427 [Colletotrichum plurivorum]